MAPASGVGGVDSRGVRRTWPASHVLRPMSTATTTTPVAWSESRSVHPRRHNGECWRGTGRWRTFREGNVHRVVRVLVGFFVWSRPLGHYNVLVAVIVVVVVVTAFALFAGDGACRQRCIKWTGLIATVE